MERWITSVANVKVKPKLAEKASEYAKLIVEEAEYDQEGEIRNLTVETFVRLGLKDAHSAILGSFLGSRKAVREAAAPEIVVIPPPSDEETQSFTTGDKSEVPGASRSMNASQIIG